MISAPNGLKYCKHDHTAFYLFNILPTVPSKGGKI